MREGLPRGLLGQNAARRDGADRPEDDSSVLRKYLEEIARYPTLAPERERELGKVIQDAVDRGGEKEAIDELVRGNLRFVVSYAKRFHSPEVSFLDLINEGNIGLIQAARRFDPERGVKFITYAVWWVRQAIRTRSPSSRARSASRKAGDAPLAAGRVKEALSRSLGREATVDEIASEAGSPPTDAGGPLPPRTAESLSESFGPRRTGRSRTPSSRRRSRRRTRRSCAAPRSSRRAACWTRLPKKEREVLCRRFGIPEDGSDGEREPKTLQEIGEELKLSRERVRQIEAQAIARLKRTMKSRALKAYSTDE